MQKIRTLGVAFALALPLGSVAIAQAEQAENAGCWGQATTQIAPLGDHARDVNAGGFIDSRNGPDGPGRIGIGNLAGAQDGGADLAGLAGALGVDCSELSVP